MTNKAKICLTLASDFMKVHPNLIISASQKREIADARKLVFSLMYDYYGIGWSEIAKDFNMPSHATVLHAYNAFTSLKQTNKEVKDIHAACIEILKEIKLDDKLSYLLEKKAQKIREIEVLDIQINLEQLKFNKEHARN